MMNRKDIESINRLLREEVFDKKQEGSPKQEKDTSPNEPRYNKSMKNNRDTIIAAMRVCPDVIESIRAAGQLAPDRVASSLPEPVDPVVVATAIRLVMDDGRVKLLPNGNLCLRN